MLDLVGFLLTRDLLKNLYLFTYCCINMADEWKNHVTKTDGTLC